MKDFSPIYTLPNKPAVYALYSGGRGPQYVAYVGIAGKLKQRIVQHLIRRDSSVATGASAVALIPDHVTGLSYWEHSSFEKTAALKAAEMVAFEVLNPALRSRAGDDKAGRELLQDDVFRTQLHELFEGEPTGSVKFPSLADVVERLSKIEKTVQILETQIRGVDMKKVVQYPFATRGPDAKRKFFNYRYHNETDTVIINAEHGKQHRFTTPEISNVLRIIKKEFGDQYFPLANNVQWLHEGTEKRGLGSIIYELSPGDTYCLVPR